MIQYDNRGNIRKGITATKLRNLFGLFSDLYNQMLRQEEEQLTEDQMDTLRTARIRIVYECGRE